MHVDAEHIRIFNGSIIDNILQSTKHLIDEWLNLASEKLRMFIVHNRFFEGYEVPYDKFEMFLMYGDEIDGNNFLILKIILIIKYLSD